MPILKNSRHEKFAQALVKGMSQTDAAIEAGYSPKWARSFASYLLTNLNIVERRAELLKLAETDVIMSATERKERLSEIARARLSDFLEVVEDGSVGKIDIKAGHSAALQEVTVTELSTEEASLSKRATKVKLHDPVKSIAELNKMEGIYNEGTRINIDNRRIEIIVSSETAKQLTEKIIEGENT